MGVPAAGVAAGLAHDQFGDGARPGRGGRQVLHQHPGRRRPGQVHAAQRGQCLGVHVLEGFAQPQGEDVVAALGSADGRVGGNRLLRVDLRLDGPHRAVLHQGEAAQAVLPADRGQLWGDLVHADRTARVPGQHALRRQCRGVQLVLVGSAGATLGGFAVVPAPELVPELPAGRDDDTDHVVDGPGDRGLDGPDDALHPLADPGQPDQVRQQAQHHGQGPGQRPLHQVGGRPGGALGDGADRGQHRGDELGDLLRAFDDEHGDVVDRLDRPDDRGGRVEQGRQPDDSGLDDLLDDKTADLVHHQGDDVAGPLHDQPPQTWQSLGGQGPHQRQRRLQPPHHGLGDHPGDPEPHGPPGQAEHGQDQPQHAPGVELVGDLHAGATQVAQQPRPQAGLEVLDDVAGELGDAASHAADQVAEERDGIGDDQAEDSADLAEDAEDPRGAGTGQRQGALEDELQHLPARADHERAQPGQRWAEDGLELLPGPAGAGQVPHAQRVPRPAEQAADVVPGEAERGDLVGEPRGGALDHLGLEQVLEQLPAAGHQGQHGGDQVDRAALDGLLGDGIAAEDDAEQVVAGQRAGVVANEVEHPSHRAARAGRRGRAGGHGRVAHRVLVAGRRRAGAAQRRCRRRVAQRVLGTRPRTGGGRQRSGGGVAHGVLHPRGRPRGAGPPHRGCGRRGRWTWPGQQRWCGRRHQLALLVAEPGVSCRGWSGRSGARPLLRPASSVTGTPFRHRESAVTRPSPHHHPGFPAADRRRPALARTGCGRLDPLGGW